MERIEGAKKVCRRDVEDEPDPQFVPEFEKDIMSHLRAIEHSRRAYPFMFDHTNWFTPKERQTGIEYITSLCREYHCLNDTLHTSVAIFDQCVSKNLFFAQTSLRLFAMSCFLIGAKFEEIYPPDVSMIVQHEAKNNLIEMEKQTLICMNYVVCLPTAIPFLRFFSRISNSGNQEHYFAKYFVEVALKHYDWIFHFPSLWAISAVVLSHLTNEPELFYEKEWFEELAAISQHKPDLIEICIEKLCLWIKQSQQEKCIVFEKYARPQTGKVANTQVPSEEMIKQFFKK